MSDKFRIIQTENSMRNITESTEFSVYSKILAIIIIIDISKFY